MVLETITGLTELLVDGLARGLVLALLGIGITVVFGLGGVLNLAIGVFSVLAVIVTMVALDAVGFLPAAMIASVAVVGAVGLAVDRSLLSLVYRSEGEERILLGIFTTLGLALFLDGLLYVSYSSTEIPSTSVLGADVQWTLPLAVLAAAVGFAILYARTSMTREEAVLGGVSALVIAVTLERLIFVSYPSNYGLSSGIPSTTVLGVQIRGSSIAIIGVTIAAFAVLYYFFSRTYLGGATRTVLQDETGAILCGISPRRMRTLVFVLSAATAALAGILYSFAFEVSVAAGFEFTILAIIVSIVGGVTSVLGAVVAGILLGVVVTFTSAFIGAYVAEVVLFLVAVVALIVKPEQVA